MFGFVDAMLSGVACLAGPGNGVARPPASLGHGTVRVFHILAGRLGCQSANRQQEQTALENHDFHIRPRSTESSKAPDITERAGGIQSPGWC